LEQEVPQQTVITQPNQLNQPRLGKVVTEELPQINTMVLGTEQERKEQQGL
jgi:hypothetical protein